MKTLAANSNTSEQAKVDKELAKIMQTGKKAMVEQAFGQIYKRYKQAIFFKIVMKAVKNSEAAEDLVQEIFAKIFMNIKQYDFSTALSTWMFNLAKNHTIDYLRKEVKHEVLSIESLKSEFVNDDDVSKITLQIEDKSEDTFKSIVRSERADALRNALENGVKSYDARKIIRLIFLEELSYEEASQKMNMPLGTVKTLMFRAKGEIKEFLSRKSLDFTYVN